MGWSVIVTVMIQEMYKMHGFFGHIFYWTNCIKVSQTTQSAKFCPNYKVGARKDITKTLCLKDNFTS